MVNLRGGRPKGTTWVRYGGRDARADLLETS